MSIKSKIKTVYNNKKTKNQIIEIKQMLDEQKIKLIYCEVPIDFRMNYLSPAQKNRVENWVFDFNNVSENELKLLSEIYENVSPEYLVKLYEGVKIINVGDHKKVCDFRNEYVNIVNGIRITVNQPKEYNRSIHIYGACTVRGTGVEDSQTISSYLQNMIPHNIRVVNHGIGWGSSIMDDIYEIKRTTLYEDDIVIICNYDNENITNYFNKMDIKTLYSSEAFREVKGEWFTDKTFHTTALGNKTIAEFLYDGLFDELSKSTKELKNKEVYQDKKINNVEDFDSNEELRLYLKSLDDICPKTGTSGAIVMNCNPFTLGHYYLIETASKQVDHLFIFVVEEDKSYFPFLDRLDLVRKGTSKLSNVRVIPSGKFIISAITFPGYFYKDNDNDAIVDTSMDIDIFGKYIAPHLNISKRFAGEEPIDMVTRQYNITMEERLPLYNIEFCEIPRKTTGEEVISASRVRKYIKEKDFESISKIVPETTLEYLKERFGGN